MWSVAILTPLNPHSPPGQLLGQTRVASASFFEQAKKHTLWWLSLNQLGASLDATANGLLADMHMASSATIAEETSSAPSSPHHGVLAAGWALSLCARAHALH